tara:strand:+ start:13626 stop:14621 length:996 start_codon:yes stop_codon:yes gene_type:complete
LTGDTSQNRLLIGFFGGGPQALECVGRIVADRDFIVAFVHLRDPDDEALRAFCVANDIDILDERDANAAATLVAIGSYHVDLIVSVNAKQIFRQPLLDIPTRGAVNIHNGLLPRQRGGGGAYTAIINGETPGTTVHFIDDGIDTGDIITQREIPLGPNETMGDFQQRAISASAELLLVALGDIRNGTETRIPQRDQPFHYTPSKAPWDELIDWSQTSRMILDKIRARKPGPANFYICDDEVYEVVEATPEPNILDFFSTFGQVLQRHPEKGLLVKTGDNGLWLNRVRKHGEEMTTVPNHPSGKMLRYMVDRELFYLKRRLAVLEAGQTDPQ